MPADRFYLNVPLTEETVVKLEEQEHHHLSRVMRVSPGEEVELVNGHGSIAKAIVSRIDKQATTLQILTLQTIPRPSHQIILAIPLMRPNKLELILEKGTELGADGFWMYPADFSEKAELSSNQLERLRNLTISSLKQSGRLFLPSLEVLSSLENIHGFILFGDTRENAPKIIHTKLKTETIFISGPERGFSPKEVEFLEQKGHGVKLNPNILRAETAPLAAMSILGSLF